MTQASTSFILMFGSVGYIAYGGMGVAIGVATSSIIIFLVELLC